MQHRLVVVNKYLQIQVLLFADYADHMSHIDHYTFSLYNQEHYLRLIHFPRQHGNQVQVPHPDLIRIILLLFL